MSRMLAARAYLNASCGRVEKKLYELRPGSMAPDLLISQRR